MNRRIVPIQRKIVYWSGLVEQVEQGSSQLLLVGRRKFFKDEGGDYDFLCQGYEGLDPATLQQEDFAVPLIERKDVDSLHQKALRGTIPWQLYAVRHPYREGQKRLSLVQFTQNPSKEHIGQTIDASSIDEKDVVTHPETWRKILELKQELDRQFL